MNFSEEPQCKGCNELKDGKCTRIGKHGETGICWMELNEGEY